MQNLKKYVASLNAITAIFDGEADANIDLNNLDNAVAQRIFNYIEGDLSPENLCCDGELPFAAVKRKANMLNKARDELIAMGFEHTPEF